MTNKKNYRALVADDEESIRELLREVLEETGIEVDEASDGEEAWAILNRTTFDLLFLDIRMPRKDGMTLLRELMEKENSPHTIIITAYGDFTVALEAMKLGAFNYIHKPFDLEEVKLLAEKALRLKSLEEEVKVLRAELCEKGKNEPTVIGHSAKMLEIMKTVGRFANSSSTVLITGESGTGKELIARTIHLASPRAKGPFLPVNCAAIPESLLESELFGYEKGAFTGALQRTPGKFELAERGTIFLDEIADMSLALQAKLLRVLQDLTFMRVGGKEPVQVDVRVIAATNHDIGDMVKKEGFREDLYYRLNVLTLQLPPLRERREDIDDLVLFFMAHYARENNKPLRGVTTGALEKLIAYSWPGNVRELENAVARAVARSVGNILTLEDFDLEEETLAQEGPVPIIPLSRAVAELEKKMIQQALQVSGGNQTQAARLLEISRQTLATKIKEYDIKN